MKPWVLFLLGLILWGCPNPCRTNCDCLSNQHCLENRCVENRKADYPAGTPSVEFIGKNHRIRVYTEIADQNDLREKGLMFRRKLKAFQGMIFIFPQEKVQHFWMKNTYLSLDLIFVNADKRVVGIIEKTEPLKEDSLSVGPASKYVIEVNACFTRHHRISLGDRVEMNNIE